MKNSPDRNMVQDFVASYTPKSQIALAASILGFGLVGITPAQAATFTHSGTTTGAPTWDRPDQNGTAAPIALSGLLTGYNLHSFTVIADGSYVFENDAPTYDSYGFLYQGTFDPLNPLNNIIIGNDDGVNGSNYGFTANLTAGMTYSLISTGFDNNNSGAFIATITGPVSASVPEPFTIVGTLVGGTAALRMRKKLKSTTKA